MNTISSRRISIGHLHIHNLCYKCTKVSLFMQKLTPCIYLKKSILFKCPKSLNDFTVCVAKVTIFYIQTFPFTVINL